MQSTDILKLPMHCNALSGYLMDESLLIYSNNTQNVYGFEKESAALFLQIDELVGTQSEMKIAAQFPGVDATLIKDMINLAACREKADIIEYEADLELGNYREDTLSRTFYQVDDTAFAINYSDNSFYERFHPVISHLHTQKTDAKQIVSVDFVQNGDLWEIHWNDAPVEMAIPEPKLATYLQEKMMTSAYQAHKYLISLHAGSVEKEGKVVIMPAVAESGKTTLTATLVHHGYRLFSDEVSVLDHEGYVHPLPFCMNIKEGSWKVLTPMYPHLAERDTHKRFDDKNIRFLPPKNMHPGPRKASHIVFPKYIPGSKTTLTPLSSKEALSRIKEASYQIQYNMDENKFELILKHLIALPKYSLEYSNGDEAVTVINGLIQNVED